MIGGWIKLYRAILDDPVWTTSTADQKAVLVTVLLMASHEPRQWAWQGRKFDVQPGQFVTSLASLSEKAGVSVQSVRSAIARLERLGFLTNQSTKSGRLISVRKWNAYQGQEWSSNKEGSKDTTKGQQLSRRKKGKKPSCIIKEEDFWADFAAFWDRYPRKVGKQAAYKAWGRLNPDSDLKISIFAALEKQKATEQWRRDDGKYIPHASTWLNGRRWEDEIGLTSTDPVRAEPDRNHQRAVEEVAKRYGLT